MALYGNLKANNLIYNLDDGAGDVSVALSQVGDKAPLASPTFTGDVTINNQGDLRLYDSGSSHYIGVQAPANVAANLVWTLPGADGSSGQLLQTDGSGTLSWSTTDLSGYALKAGDTFTGDLVLDNGKKLTLSETDANGSHYLSFKAPDSVTANVDFTLPDGDGTNGQLLQTNGSGVLSWSTTDLSSYAPLASPALTGTATAVNLTISGNLTVNGTTTELNSTTLTVDDKNIELGTVADKTSQATTADLVTTNAIVTVADTTGYLVGATVTKVAGTGAFNASGVTIASVDSATQFTVSANHATAGAITDFTVDNTTDITANGGGITLKGDTDKTILWTDATDSWDFNQDIKTSGTVTDSKGDVRTIPKIIKTSAYTPTDTSDVGKVIFISTGGVTINNSIYAAGDVITIINDSGSDQTITQGSATIYNTSDASTGNRTLAGRGMATIWFAAHNEAYITGSGLS
jgi:hypothetical protein